MGFSRTILLAACAALAGATSAPRADLLSRTGAVIAIMGGELFVGEAEGHYGGDGTLAIHAQRNPALTCTGEFTSSAELGGRGQLRCSDGAGATFRFDRLSIMRGHGTGTFTRGPMSFTYGLSAEDSRPYLQLPAGKRLAHDGTTLELVSNP